MIVAIGGGLVDVIHHIQPSTYNVLTKKTTNMKEIIGLIDKGNPTKIRNLHLEELSKGKISRMDKLFEIEESLDMKYLCLL